MNGAQVPEWVAETAIFAGGVAIGAGVFLLKRGVTTSLRGQAVIGLGLGFFVVTILARGLSRLRSRPWSQAARTE